MDEKTVRCIRCGTEFTDKEIENVISCPSCGSKSIPCAISEDVNIKINWHELHIIVVWAEQYARKVDSEPNAPEESMLLTVMTIAQRLQKQYPNKNKLTLFGEIRQLKEDLKDSGAIVTSNLDNDEDLGL